MNLSDSLVAWQPFGRGPVDRDTHRAVYYMRNPRCLKYEGPPVDYPYHLMRPFFRPFQILLSNAAIITSTSWRTFVVHTGSVKSPVDAEKIFEATNDDVQTSPMIFTVPASTDLWKVWLKLDTTITGGKLVVDSDTALLENGAAGWADWPDLLPAAGTTWYWLIAEISTSNNTYKQATIYQYIDSHIQLPPMVADPTVDPNPDESENHCISALLVQ